MGMGIGQPFTYIYTHSQNSYHLEKNARKTKIHSISKHKEHTLNWILLNLNSLYYNYISYLNEDQIFLLQIEWMNKYNLGSLDAYSCYTYLHEYI